jgi:hypothetical protein
LPYIGILIFERAEGERQKVENDDILYFQPPTTKIAHVMQLLGYLLDLLELRNFRKQIVLIVMMMQSSSTFVTLPGCPSSV